MIRRSRHSKEHGAALIVAVFALALIAAIGASMALASTAESWVAGDFVRSQEARYAAEAAVERAIADLRTIDNWTTLPAGGAVSGLTDGPPFGVRRLPGGGTLDLGRVVNLANCGKPTICTDADLAANTTGQRPWGANNPVWRLFAYAPLAALLPAGAMPSAEYVVVLLADDPSETDANPSIDGAEPCTDGKVPPACNPGSGVLALRGEAFGARGTHQTVQVLVERPSTPGWPLKIRAEHMSGID